MKMINQGANNGQFKTGLNTFKIKHLDELIGTNWLKILRRVIRTSIKIDSNNCWIWTNSLDQTGGYGTLMVGNRPHMVHRIAWAAFNGPIQSQCVLHRCDVRACCNPEHLFLGSKRDNSIDRDTKLRQSKGEKVNTARLTAAQVLEARRLDKLGYTTRQIYELIDCPANMNTLRTVIRGLTWKWLK